ncbi:hypothetical protein Tco_0564166 [Tanacetum coccineum]
MSIYKVPKKIINSLESIHCHFFNGVDHLSKKPIWIKWKKVLAPIDKGGLRISSFYALNRALLFKWIWRFYTQDSSLWAKVIKGIHGEDGKIDKPLSNLHSSTWLDIVKVSLNQQGMNFVGYIHKKMGNGLHTYFCDDIWKGDTALKILYPRIYALETNKTFLLLRSWAKTTWVYLFEGSLDEELNNLNSRRYVNSLIIQCSWIRWIGGHGVWRAQENFLLRP